jgi:hypothetical protein
MHRRCTHDLRVLAIGQPKPILVVFHIDQMWSINP